MQASLFGEPRRDPALSQLFTPPWLARRLASWVVRGARVLEPSCGGGALLDALVRTGHQLPNLTGVDVDERWVRHCCDRWPGMRLVHGDFLDAVSMPFGDIEFDLVVMNPPFEENAHMRFVLRALELVPAVAGIFPSSFEYSLQRDRELWARRGVVRRRARLPERVDYGGGGSTNFDSVALWIDRRERPRAAGERVEVIEETWLQ